MPTLKEHTVPVDAVAFSSDCSKAASRSMDNSVRLWDVARPAAVKAMGKIDHMVLRHLALSPDGKSYAATDTSPSVWDTASGERLFGVSPALRAWASAYSPYGTTYTA